MSMDANGLSLTKFCEKYNLPYARIWYRMSVKGMNLAEAIKHFRETEDKPAHCKNYVNGMSARQYCIKNNLKYEQLMTKCHKKKCTIEDYLKKTM